MKSQLALTFLLASLLTGCTTTSTSRLRDDRAAKTVGDYRNRQEKRIKEATQEYQRTFEEQMRLLNDLGKREFDQAMDGDALSLADRLALDWPELTVPSQLQGALTESLHHQLDVIAKVEANLEAARKAYAAAYADATFEVKKLEAAQNGLQQLATRPKEQKELTAFLRAVLETYQKARKQAEEEKKGEK